MLSGVRIFRKKFALVLLAVFCVPFTVILLQRDDGNLICFSLVLSIKKSSSSFRNSRPGAGGARLEEELTSEIAHLRQRVSQVEMINQARRRDLALLTQHVNKSIPWSK